VTASRKNAPPRVLIPIRKAGRERLHISSSTLYRLEASDPTFPRRVFCGSNPAYPRWAFFEDELQAWIDSRMRIADVARPEHRNLRPRASRRAA
jgi:predicted DNA-binding transcriptional regulator AlpA